MRRSSENLRKLMLAISRGEKAYIRRNFPTTKSDKKLQYIHLYDIIENNPQYDEKNISSKLGKSLAGKSIAMGKQYLYNYLCSCLRVYYAQRFSEHRVSELVLTGKLLFNRNLIDAGWSIMKRAAEVAEKMELFHAMMDIYRWQRTHLHLTKFGSASKNNALRIKETSAIRKYKNQLEFQQIAMKANKLLLFNPDNSKDLSAHFLELTNNPMVNSRENALSYRATCEYYRFWRAVRFFDGDHQAGIVIHKEFIDYLESHPEFINEDPLFYLESLCLLIDLLGRVSTYEELQKMYLKVDKLLKNKKHDLETDIGRRMYLVYVSALSANICEHYNFDRLDEIIKVTKNAIGHFAESFEQRFKIVIFFNIANAFFLKEDYQLALTWLNKIIQNKTFDHYSTDWIALSRLQHWFILYELESVDLLEYSISSAKRLLRKKNGLTQLVKIVTQALTKLASFLPESAECKNILMGGLTELKNIQDSRNLNRSNLENECLKLAISWFDSKVQGKPIVEL